MDSAEARAKDSEARAVKWETSLGAENERLREAMDSAEARARASEARAVKWETCFATKEGLRAPSKGDLKDLFTPKHSDLPHLPQGLVDATEGYLTAPRRFAEPCAEARLPTFAAGYTPTTFGATVPTTPKPVPKSEDSEDMKAILKKLT